MLPAGLVIGFFAWAGTAVALTLIRLLSPSRRLRSGTGPPAPENIDGDIPEGTSAFVATSLICSIAVGSLVAFVAERHGLLLVVGTYGLAGLLFGSAVRWAARTGWLPFPKDEY
jgi:hypothetical protein